MMTILLIAVAVAAALAVSVTAVGITAVRPQVEAVSPFAVGRGTSADTMSSANTDTVLPERRAGDWTVTTLASLADAESFLDHLENCRVTEREMHVLSNNLFAVRWRKVA